MAQIILVRHGQASFGAEEYDQLSATGERQSAQTAKHLPKDTPLISGSLRRHIQTAEPVAQGRAVTQDPDWNEFDYLDVIGALRPELSTQAALVAAFRHAPDPRRAFQTLYDQALARWASGAHDGDYRESRPAFRARVARAWARLDGGPAIVFTSGGPIAALVQQVLGLTEQAVRQIEYTLANASLTVLSAGRTPKLITLNAHTHLAAEPGLVTFR